MRFSKVIVLVILFIAGVYIFRGFIFGSDNLKQKKEYWENEIASFLKPGTSKAELEEFAIKHSQTLDCYKNYQHEDQCDFVDADSIGGLSTHPVKLAIIFTIKDGIITSHKITPTPVDVRE